MIDADALLSDLQKQVTALESDLREQVDTEKAIGARLRAEYATAFRLKRTADTQRAWEDERITQAAVAWVLGTVFVRFCEDNGLITERYLAGTGDADLVLAEESEADYFRTDSDPTFRGWLERAFDTLSATQAGRALFAPDHNALYHIPVSHDGAKALVNFWRRRGPDGTLVHRFDDAEWETRFLGDLYQRLSEAARKRYALLQTPEFVEEFILDRTLTPAIAEFGHEGLKVIDPTCGSGHFVLGAFHRLLAVWEDQAPGRERHERVRLALDSVHGVDINPFAVAIARFRLLIEALKAAGFQTLEEAKGLEFPLHLAVGDALIKFREDTIPGVDPTSAEEFSYATEDIRDHPDILKSGRYHVVVGNPPYITVKDKNLNALYRRTYKNVCHRQYALSVPFARRFFELAKPGDGTGRGAGHVGQITANSFMKREFGAHLVAYFDAWVNLTEIIDTSGAFIPGHGTPTVILIGRNTTRNRAGTIRAVMGIQGEPGEPEDPSKGMVWRAIVSQVDSPRSESLWASVDDLPRRSFGVHPWSVAGGGAAGVRQQIEESCAGRLKSRVSWIGFMAVTRADDAYVVGRSVAQRLLDDTSTVPFVTGSSIRDFELIPEPGIVFPYTSDGAVACIGDKMRRLLWCVRQQLATRMALSGTQEDRGLAWFEYSDFHSYRWNEPVKLAFACVATHNHFIVDRGKKLFNRHAPVIGLKAGDGEGEYLDLYGVLNSSTGCFWLKQVSHDKGIRGEAGGFTSSDWERFYEFTGTKLEQFPLPKAYPVERARELDGLARRLGRLTPAAVCGEGVPTRQRLEAAKAEYTSVRARMIALQEELDWEVYRLYGLLGEDLTVADPAELKLGERAFEIAMERSRAEDEPVAQWFVRHGSTPIKELPEHWSPEYKALVERRIALIESDRNIGLIERPECKRRWSADPWKTMEHRALRDWLADRCERRELWYASDDRGEEQPRPLSINQLADLLRADDDVTAVAALYQPRTDLAKVLASILADEHVPFLPVLRYKPSGMAKRAGWEHVWEMQRAEDAATDEAEKKKIREETPIPQKYVAADFRRKSYWDQRGKLDVPKERFISYPHCGRDADPSELLGWAGWGHREQAHVLATLVTTREQSDGWRADRLAPLLAGLREVMPWVRQWHGEYDPEWGASPAEEYGGFLTETAQRLHLTDDDLATWHP